jgi:hypothetical protein
MQKTESLEKFLESAAYNYFTNSDTDKFAFHRLSVAEKREVSTQLVIHEFLDQAVNLNTVKDAAKTDTGNDTVNGESYQPAGSLSVAYFNKILASNGDIRKTPNYANNRSLIAYAKSVVHNTKETEGSKEFMRKLTELELAINNLEKYTSDFVKAIAQEAKEFVEEKKRVITQFYLNVVTAIDLAVDVLYSSSIQAVIDLTQKPALVSSVFFECKKDLISELLTMIHYFNSMAISGKLRSALSSANVQALQTAKDKILKENNVLDVVFAVITSNRWTDLLLLPLYMVRMVVYAVMYLKASYQKLAFSTAKSVAMIRSKQITEEDFKAYKKEADTKAIQVDQATKKAAIEISTTVKSDTENISNLAKQSNASSSTLI